jgi:EmrB/QacA subfamily drug resistance transporter
MTRPEAHRLNSTAHPRVRHWQILAVIILAEFVVELGASTINVALPTMARELHATTRDLQWVVDSYIVALALLLVFCGAIVDWFGARRMLFGALSVFFAASVLAAVSNDVNELIATRVLMGSAAAMILPATLAILVDVFAPNERARAFSIWSGAVGLSFVIGPVVGGWLVERGGWSAIFWINLPILAAALAAGVAILPPTRRVAERRFDPVGLLLVVPGFASLVYAIIDVPSRGWTDPVILAAFVVAAALLSAFVAWQARRTEPMVNLRSLRGTGFAAAATTLAMTFLPVTGSLFIATQYLQGVLGYTPLGAGLRTLPVAAAFLIGSLLSVVLGRRAGTKLTVATGLVLLASSLFVMSTVSDASGYPLLLWSFLLGGLGMGLALTPATGIVLTALPITRAGIGSALNTTALTVGGALGVAVLGSVVSSQYVANLGALAKVAGGSLNGALQLGLRQGGAEGMLIVAHARHAFVEAMGPALSVGGLVAAVGSIVAITCLPRAPVKAASEETSAAPTVQPL